MRTKDEIQGFIDIIASAEKKIFEAVDELPGAGSDCNCDEPTIYKYIHEGNHFDEIMTICISCGGAVWDRSI